MFSPADMLRSLIAVALAGMLAAGGPAQAARVALVVGNQHYDKLQSLEKPAADARDYGRLFQDKGFDSVTVRVDLTRSEMDEALADFIASINTGDTAVFVYSGHGWSDGAQNYIVGTDAPLKASEEYLKRISVPIKNGVNGIMDEIEARGASLKVAIIDACRDNPFVSSSPTRSIGMTRGLNRMAEPPPVGTFMVFSAGAGQTALDRLADDDPHPNGLFTRIFIPLLQQDLTLLDAVKSAQEEVYREAKVAGYDQQPAYYDETRGNRACLSSLCGKVATDTPVDPVEAEAWTKASAKGDANSLYEFFYDYPGGQHRLEALERVAELSRANPADAPMFLLLGDMSRAVKQYGDAVAAYSRAIAITPDWRGYYLRGITHERMGDWPAAEADLVSALAVSPNQPRVLNNLGYFLVDNGEDVARGVALLEKAYALDPGNGEIVDSIGWGYFKLGRFAEASTYLEKATLALPTDPEISEHLGDAEWRLSKTEEARARWAVAQALTKDPAAKERLTAKLRDGLPAVQ